MRGSYIATIMTLSFAGLPLCAQSADIAQWSATGGDLYEKCASPDGTIAHACGEYLLGLVDGAIMSMPAGAQLFCPPAKFSFFQLEAAYISWAKANPDLLGRSRGMAAAGALSAAFPCPKR